MSDKHDTIKGSAVFATAALAAVGGLGVATPALAEEATAPATEAATAQVTTQAPATAEQAQQSEQKAYDDAAKAAADAQAKADATTAPSDAEVSDAQKAAGDSQAKANEAQKADAAKADAEAKDASTDAAKSKLDDAQAKADSAQSALDKAQSDKSAADAAAKDAKSKLDEAQSTADAAAADAKSKSDAAQAAKDSLDAASKAYEAATKGDPMTVAQFLDSISNGEYSKWAAQTYHDLSNESVTNKANGSNMTYENFLAALDLIDHLNQYRTTHGLDAYTVSGYEMAGQMLECDLMDDNIIVYHTSFWGYAGYKDLAWGYANGTGRDAVDGWLEERDLFKKDAEAYATNGYKVADGKYTPASDEYKAALAAVDWSNEPSIHTFYNTYTFDVDAYVQAAFGGTHEYGHWTSLTSSSAKYVGMGYSTSDPTYGTAEAAAGRRSDVTGTTDYFRTLVAEARPARPRMTRR